MDTNRFHHPSIDLPPANRTLADVERSLALSVRTFLRLPHDAYAKQAKIRRQQNVLLDRWLLIESNQLHQ